MEDYKNPVSALWNFFCCCSTYANNYTLDIEFNIFFSISELYVLINSVQMSVQEFTEIKKVQMLHKLKDRMIS